MRFPPLRPVIMDIIVQILQELRDNTRRLVEAIIDSELNYHFTNNNDFKDIAASNHPPAQQMPPGGMPPGQQAPPQYSGNAIVRDLRVRIDKYFALVLRNVRDTIPKQIGFFLVRKSQDALQNDLYMRISKNPNIIQALGEPKQITERRMVLNQLCETLDNSIKVLTRDPEITAAHHDDGALAEDIRQDQLMRKQQQAQGPPGSQQQQVS